MSETVVVEGVQELTLVVRPRTLNLAGERTLARASVRWTPSAHASVSAMLRAACAVP